MSNSQSLLKSLLIACVALVNAQAQAPMRILYPEQVTGNGEGWSVDPHAGALGLTFPVATVAGEIPIPVVYRMAGTHTVENHTITRYKLDKTGEMVPYYVPNNYDRPVFASLHFGFINNAHANYGGYIEPAMVVLENGQRLGESDFATRVPTTFTLAGKFGLGATAAAAAMMDSSGTLALYDATAADLGTWATTILQPQGYGTLADAYKVVMDRDRARVFMFLPALASWVPVLWVDRFSHAVTFQWQQFTVNLPAEIQTLHTVKVLNTRGKGLQLQWAVPVSGSSSVLMDLVRADFIGVQAPSLQIKGYFGFASARPSGMSVSGSAYYPIQPEIAGPYGRPTEVKTGNPSGFSTPTWLAAGLPQPSASYGSTWAPDLAWTFSYDTNLAEAQAFTDPRSVRTSFLYETHLLYSFDTYLPPGALRGVTSASAQDSATGTTLDRAWAYTMPTSAAPAWGTIARQQFSSGSSATPIRTEYTFAGFNDPNYGNGTLLSTRLVDDATGLELAKTSMTPAATGVDGTLTAPAGTTVSQLGAPSALTSNTLDFKSGFPTASTTTVGSYSQTTTTPIEKHPEILEPARIVATSTTRTVNSQTYSAPSQKTVFDPNTFLPTQTYADAGADGQMGQKMGDDGQGHLNKAYNYASFSTSGVATRSLIIGTNGAPSSGSTSYDGSTSGSLSESWGYNAEDRTTSSTDANGITTIATYDTRGRVKSVKAGSDPIITYDYPDERSRTVTQSGISTSESWDGFGRTTTRSRADGVVENYTYDQNGRVSAVAEVAAGTSRSRSMTYDGLGRPTLVAPSSGPSISYSYQAIGSDSMTTTTLTGTGTNAVSTSYQDMWGQVVKSIDPAGTITTAIYNGLGQATSVTINNVQTRTFQFNGLGLMTSRTEPETHTTTFSAFNAQGKPGTITQDKGGIGGGLNRTLTMTYDGLGRLTAVSNGSADNSTFTFQGLRLMNAATVSGGASSSTTYAYTGPNGRLSQEQSTPPGATSPFITSYGYDGQGRMTSLTYPSGRIVGYGYDNQSRISSLTMNGAALVPVVGYDAWGNRNEVDFASGAKSAWQADPFGMNLVKWTVSPVGSSALVRD